MPVSLAHEKQTQKRLMDLCYWLNEEDREFYSMADDIERQRWVKQDLKNVKTPEEFVRVVRNNDLTGIDKESIAGLTLGDIAYALSAYILDPKPLPDPE